MPTVDFLSRLEPGRHDIWRYADLLGFSDKKNRILSKQNLWTPLEKIGDCYIKREDQSITGSHKLRSLIYQLSQVKASAGKSAVISSSGNAAITASRYAAAAGIHLFVFLSRETPPGKLNAISAKNTTIIFSDRPLRLAKYAAAHFRLPDLRPSIDPHAAVGFQSLGFELFEQGEDALIKKGIDNIFSFVTSGASLRGISDAYAKLLQLGAIAKVPSLFGVYSSGKLAGTLSTDRADKHVDIEQTCKSSGGRLIEINDAEILSTRKELIRQKIKTSDEGVASFCAAKKIQPTGNTVVVFTGKIWPDKPADLAEFETAETFSEVDQLISKYVSY